MAAFLDFTFASNEEVALALGARIKAYRLFRGQRQADLAASAGVALATLKALENQGTCTLSSLIQIVRALGLEGELQALFAIPEPRSIAAMEAQAEAPRQRARSRQQKPRA